MGINEDDAHKELSASPTYTEYSIRAFVINHSWRRVSLTRMQQELSKKHLIHSRASYKIANVWSQQVIVLAEREPWII